MRRVRLRRGHVLLGVAGLILAGLGVVSVEVTSQSAFCGTCHIMQPFHASWLSSTHAETTCVECHIAPGAESFIAAKLNGAGQVVDDWLNRVSTKPSASVSNFSCTRSGCHTLDALDPVPASGRVYRFAHAPHLTLDHAGLVVGCTTCHSHVRGLTHFEVNTNVCVVCHLAPTPASVAPNGGIMLAGHTSALPAHGPAGREDHVPAPATCDTCHDPPAKPFTVAGLVVDHATFLEYNASCDSCHYGVTATPRAIDDDRCYSCHVFGLEAWTSTVEMHAAHSGGERKVECFECHGWVRHGPQAQQMEISRFACENCHVDQHRVQRSTYAEASDPFDPSPRREGATPEISPMFMAHVGCPACHIKPAPVSTNPLSGATVNVAVPEACDRCHEPGLGGRMIPLWQNATRDLFDDAFEMLHEARQRGDAAADARLDAAERLLDLVRVDGSWGVHNPAFTERLIARARGLILGGSASGEHPPVGDAP